MTNWRELGDIPPEVYEAEFRAYGSPLLAEARAVWEATRPHSALCLAMSWVEQKHATWSDSPIPRDAHNPLSLSAGWANGAHVWARFPSWAAGVAAWRERLLNPQGPYAGTTTLAELIAIYAPAHDRNDEGRYARQIEEQIARYRTMAGAGGNTSVAPNMTRGLIPLPPMTDRIIPDAQNRAWDNLGQRTIKGVVLHRQIGTNWGTDGWFRTMWQANGQPGGGQLGLTDLGIDHKTGEILVWNDALGRSREGVSPNRSGYASGRVSKPYGDGAAFIAKYGVNAVNRDQRSIEIAGNYDSPVSDVCLERIAQVIAHDAHNYGIPWDQFPIAPQDGFSFVRWHQEYTIGTGKVCPGQVVMELTDRIIARAKEILRAAQLAGEVPPAPPPPQPPAVFVPFPRPRDFHAHAGAVARQYGNQQAPVRKRFTGGELVSCAGYYRGERVNGDDRWLLTLPSKLRIHASGVKEVI